MPSKEDIEKVHDLMYEQVNGLPFRNVTCITTHCMSEVGACLVDSVCRDNFQCAGACGDNSTCTFMCSESYKSKAQDSLMYCMFQGHNCLTLPEPQPIDNATCRNPASAVVGELE